jgi:transposase
MWVSIVEKFLISLYNVDNNLIRGAVMSKPYSEDLRVRVIQVYVDGMPKINIINIFKIGMDTLNRWIRQYLETGEVKPKQRTKFRARKFSDADLIDYVKNNPSTTLKEMAEHFCVKAPSIRARLKSLGITYKKNVSIRRKR